MALAIFDLDETLVDGDCSSRWVEYMLAQQLADSDSILAEEARLMEDYYRGELDMYDYMAMLLRPLVGMTLAQLEPLVEGYIQQCVAPYIRTAARDRLAQLHKQGDITLIISASPTFLVTPIARYLGMQHGMGVDIELDAEGRITGRAEGVITYQGGKVERLQQWLDGQNINLAGSSFYSDSHNDLPLLDVVEVPVAVTPDATLKQLAQQRGWTVLWW
ncbi:MAG: HAD-IB family hydrolase [Marinobacterium sp.]|nr:HAD-IB family hydrolase [Marinobacterium sp.]